MKFLFLFLFFLSPLAFSVVDLSSVPRVLDQANYYIDHINRDAAIDVLDQGLKKYTSSDEIRMLLIRLRLESIKLMGKEVDRRVAYQTIADLAQEGLAFGKSPYF